MVTKNSVIAVQIGSHAIADFKDDGIITMTLSLKQWVLKLKRKLLFRTGIAMSGLLMVVTSTIYLAPHFGWRIDSIRSGSMVPELDVGTLVVSRSVMPTAVAVGDIIVFRPSGVGENAICHRVISIEAGPPLQFKTKGDADVAPDPFTVPARNLIGKVYYHTPLLGWLVQFFKTPAGLIMGLVAPGLFLAGICMKNIWIELVRKIRETPETKQ